MVRLGERAIRERQLAVAEAPMFALGKVRHRLGVMARAPMASWLRSELAEADAELERAQQVIAGWSGYPHSRGGKR